MLKKYNRLFILVLILQMILSMFTTVSSATINQSKMLKVSGNKIVLADNPATVVRLSGVNLAGTEWTGTPDSEHIIRSTKEAMENWNANLLRLPISVKGWYGEKQGDYQPHDGGTAYRNYIDQVISMVSAAGKYVDLDLHHYDSFNNPQYLTFWTEAATKYKNNPTVLFGILNEPTVAWPIWRNGDGNTITGHQQVVERIRDLGAKNIIIAGGRDFAYNLKGIVGQADNDPTIYALIDQGSDGEFNKTGNGIMYDTHIYPWKGRTPDWDSAVGAVRKKYPILVGECGWDATDGLQKTYSPGDVMYYDKWVPELMAWMNDEATYGNLANWTAWCFNPTATPRVIEDRDNWSSTTTTYSYPPTVFWGAYVKSKLVSDLGNNLLTGKTVTASASETGYGAANAVDGNNSSLWCSTAAGDKYLSVDLGDTKLIKRWIVRHAGTSSNYSAAYNTSDFKLQISNDQVNWKDADTVTGNTSNMSDRFVVPVQARYVRLYVTKAASSGSTLRIFEFSVYGTDKPLDFTGLKIMNGQLDLTQVGLLEGNCVSTLPVINNTDENLEVSLVSALYKINTGGKDYLCGIAIDHKMVIPKITAQTSSQYTLTTSINVPNNMDYYLKVFAVDNLAHMNNYLSQPILIHKK